MNASVEISMYPLTPQYGTPILKFINRLKAYPELEVVTNTMSTQLFGPYDLLMDVLKREVKQSFEENSEVVVVFKLINIDVRP